MIGWDSRNVKGKSQVQCCVAMQKRAKGGPGLPRTFVTLGCAGLRRRLVRARRADCATASAGRIVRPTAEAICRIAPNPDDKDQDMTEEWGQMSQAARDAAYNNSEAFPGGPAYVEALRQASLAMRAQHPEHLDLAYGPTHVIAHPLSVG